MYNSYTYKRNLQEKQKVETEQHKLAAYHRKHHHMKQVLAQRYAERVTEFVKKMQHSPVQIQNDDENNWRFLRLFRDPYLKNKNIAEETFKFRDEVDWQSILSPLERGERKLKNHKDNAFLDSNGLAKSLINRDMTSQTTFDDRKIINFRDRDSRGDIHQQPMRFNYVPKSAQSCRSTAKRLHKDSTIHNNFSSYPELSFSNNKKQHQLSSISYLENDSLISEPNPEGQNSIPKGKSGQYSFVVPRSTEMTGITTPSQKFPIRHTHVSISKDQQHNCTRHEKEVGRDMQQDLESFVLQKNNQSRAFSIKRNQMKAKSKIFNKTATTVQSRRLSETFTAQRASAPSTQQQITQLKQQHKVVKVDFGDEFRCREKPRAKLYFKDVITRANINSKDSEQNNQSAREVLKNCNIVKYTSVFGTRNSHF